VCARAITPHAANADVCGRQFGHPSAYAAQRRRASRQEYFKYAYIAQMLASALVRARCAAARSGFRSVRYAKGRSRVRRRRADSVGAQEGGAREMPPPPTPPLETGAVRQARAGDALSQVARIRQQSAHKARQALVSRRSTAGEPDDERRAPCVQRSA